MPIIILIIMAGKEQTPTRRTTQAGVLSTRRATMAMRYHITTIAPKLPEKGKYPVNAQEVKAVLRESTLDLDGLEQS